MAASMLPWKSPHRPDASMYGSMPGNGDGISHLLPRPSVYPDGRLGGDGTERPHAADAVPRILRRGRLALALVALQEAGDEQFLRQRRQLDPPRLPVVDQLVRVVEVDHLDDGARLRGVVGDLVVVL